MENKSSLPDLAEKNKKKRNVMYCRKCGKEIDNKAVICPGCGVPVENAKKKKKHPILGVIVLILGVLVIFAALGSESNEPEILGTDSPTATIPEETQKTTFTVGDKVELNGIVVTLVDVAESTGSDYIHPEEGKVFLICEFEIENNSSKDIAVSSLMSFEAYIDDYSTNQDLSATVSSAKSQLDGTIAMGKKMNGIIGYSADKDWSSIEIRFTPNFWSGRDIIFNYSK